MGSWCSGLKKVPEYQYFEQKLFLYRVAKLLWIVVEGANRYNVEHFNSDFLKNKKIIKL